MTGSEMKALLEKTYGKSADKVRVFFAPGRVNLIGEHTDYNGGKVFPLAIEAGTYLAVRPNGTEYTFRFYSENFPELGPIEADVRDLAFKAERSWVNYPLGVFNEFAVRGFLLPAGLDLAFYGNLPNASGLSSSASIEVLTAFMLCLLTDRHYDGRYIARLCQKSENRYNGVNCGIMDQFIIACGQKDKALLLDTATLQYEAKPLNLGDRCLVIMNTQKPRKLCESKYNERRAECEEAVRRINQSGLFSVKALCELKPDELSACRDAIGDETIFKRARHAVTENQRCADAARALELNDFEALGRLINASGDSLRNDYEVTGKELDTLVDAARAQEGVLCARMTGAGFGGCAIAIVQKDKVDSVCESVKKAYTAAIGYEPAFYVSAASEGPGELVCAPSFDLQDEKPDKTPFEVRGFAFCNPDIVEKNYLTSTLRYCLENGINHVQIVGPIHDYKRGNVDGMTVYQKYADFNGDKDTDFISATRDAFESAYAANASLLKQSPDFKTYVWHHELQLPDGFAAAHPEALNEFGDFEITHPLIKDFLEHKLLDFYTQYPMVDGIILTLHETSVPILRLKGQKLGPIERVQYVTNILFETCKRLGKILIVRPFASIPDDYEKMLAAYRSISPDLMVMDKWTQFDWSLTLPDNRLLPKVAPNPLISEADIFGEFFGKGRLPLMLLRQIAHKVDYLQSLGQNFKGFCARIDRNYQHPFGDVNEVNLEIMLALMNDRRAEFGLPKSASNLELGEAAARRFFNRRYPGHGDEIYDLMDQTEQIEASIIYLNGYYFSELSIFPRLNHSKNHFYFEMMRSDFDARTDLCSGEWFIPLGWNRGTLDEVFEEKAWAVKSAEALHKKLLALKGLLNDSDYNALRIKFANLEHTAGCFEALTKLFRAYTAYFEKPCREREDEYRAAIADLSRAGEDRFDLGQKLYVHNSSSGESFDYINSFIDELNAAFEAEKAERLDMEARYPDCVDYCLCGAPCESHKIKKEVNFSDTDIAFGKLFRIPGHDPNRSWSNVNTHGWFSYEMKLKPNALNRIIVEMGSFSSDLAVNVTLGTREEQVRMHNVSGIQICTFDYEAGTDETALRIRFDRVNADTPMIYSIVVK